MFILCFVLGVWSILNLLDAYGYVSLIAPDMRKRDYAKLKTNPDGISFAYKYNMWCLKWWYVWIALLISSTYAAIKIF